MIGESRPLRFVMVIVGGWIGVRVAILWRAGEPLTPQIIASSTVAEAVVAPLQFSIPQTIAEVAAHAHPERAARAQLIQMPERLPLIDGPQPQLAVALVSPAPIEGFVESEPPAQRIPGDAIGAPLPPVRMGASARSRLSGSAWLIARGSGSVAQFSPQLGGSQAGARLTYALGDSRRVALAARFSSALATRQQQAAVGVDWQPTAAPIHLFLEERVGGGQAAGVIAGLPPIPVAMGFVLDGYGQAGVIRRDGGEAFADGATHLLREVAQLGKTRIELGLGAWGGAQRGAARFDIGPAASVVIAAALPFRISFEWRERIAGSARPESGPALSIGADF